MQKDEMLQLLDYISYKDDLKIINELKDIINGNHNVIFKIYDNKSELYCYSGDFKPLEEIGWTNYKKLYCLNNDKNVSELTINILNKDFKLIHIGEQMDIKSQKTYFDFIIENQNENMDFFNKYTMFHNTIYKKDELELLSKNLFSLLIKSMKELKELDDKEYNNFRSVVIDIFKMNGLNLMNTIDFEKKDIENIKILFDNCKDRIYLKNVEEYKFSDFNHISETTKEILENIKNNSFEELSF